MAYKAADVITEISQVDLHSPGQRNRRQHTERASRKMQRISSGCVGLLEASVWQACARRNVADGAALFQVLRRSYMNDCIEAFQEKASRDILR